MNEKISIVIPALNEELGIHETLSKIPYRTLNDQGFDTEVIVVDNGCTDNTQSVAKNLGAIVVCEEKKGYGSAYKTGFKNATGNYIITCDADGTYPVEEIPNLIQTLKCKNIDFITTSRFPNGYMKTKNMPLKIKFGNMLLSVALMLLYGISLKDSQSGMWAFKSGLLYNLKLKSGGMGFSQEIKIDSIYYLKSKWLEVNIPYKNRIGEKKLKIFRDGFLNVYDLLAKRISR